MSEHQHTRHAIVVVVDRLGAGFLGPYGNTWVETPTLNRLASESILVETALADSPDLEMIYRSWWTGCHAMRVVPWTAPNLIDRAREGSLPTTLLSDASAVLDHPLAASFDEQISLSQPTPDQPASEIEETRLAQVLMTAADRLATSDSPGLLWIHARGPGGCWDAPFNIREQFRDEDDPQPYASAALPERHLEQDRDPDEILRVEHAYAAEVTVFDACLSMLLEVLDQHPCSEETLLIVTSPRGYALGEHGVIGPMSSALHAELLQTPLLIRPAGPPIAPVRLLSLAQPDDLFATLADRLGEGARSKAGAGTDLLCAANDASVAHKVCAFASGPGERAVRTPAWYMREMQGDRRALYAKPDDRWEVNEVADRCGDIPYQLTALIDQFEQAVNASEVPQLPELSPELRDGID